MQRCADGKLLARDEGEYDDKEINRILSKAADDAADNVLKAARKPR